MINAWQVGSGTSKCIVLYSNVPIMDGFYCLILLYFKIYFFSIHQTKSLWSLKRERDTYRCPSTCVWQAGRLGKDMLIELHYECQWKLQAWREGFYPWSGGLARRAPAKVATRSREIFFTLLADAMLQSLRHQTPSLAAAGCFTLSTKSVETVSSSLPFPSQAFLSEPI